MIPSPHSPFSPFLCTSTLPLFPFPSLRPYFSPSFPPIRSVPSVLPSSLPIPA